MRIFENRAFAVDNAILFLLMIPFVPLFFFASMYAQISLGESASETGLYLLIFFAGFAIASQWGGQDARPGRGAAVGGARLRRRRGRLRALGALAARPLGQLAVVLDRPRRRRRRAGAQPGQHRRAQPGVRASRYGEATGITQTVRNFGSSLGLAVLGTILILENKANLESTLGAQGVPKAQADQIADSISQGSSASSEGFAEVAGGHAQQLFAAVQHDFALASRTVFYVMAGVMALAFVVALAAMPGGKVEEPPPSRSPPHKGTSARCNVLSPGRAQRVAPDRTIRYGVQRFALAGTARA